MSPASRATHRRDMDYGKDFYAKYRGESIDKQQFRLPVNPPHNFPTNSLDLLSTASAFQVEGRLEEDGHRSVSVVRIIVPKFTRKQKLKSERFVGLAFGKSDRIRREQSAAANSEGRERCMGSPLLPGT